MADDNIPEWQRVINEEIELERKVVKLGDKKRDPRYKGFEAARGARSASALAEMQFVPLRYVVQSLMTDGCVMLAGRPKSCKSWLALDVACAVARGGFVLGDRKCGRGDVLYLALEDSDRRLHGRLSKIIGPPATTPWPRFDYATAWPRGGDGGLEGIEMWCEQHPEARLVVIDVWAAFRAPRPGKDAFSEDYDAIAEVQKLAQRLGITILIVHHTRKGAAEDPIELLNGTTGLGAAVDSFLILDRKGETGTLMGRSREIEDIDLALEWSGDGCRWRVLGDASEVRSARQSRRVLVALEEAGERGLTPRQLADAIEDTSHAAAKKILQRLKRVGKVTGSARGVYFHVPMSPSNDNACNDNDLSGDIEGDIEGDIP